MSALALWRSSSSSSSSSGGGGGSGSDMSIIIIYSNNISGSNCISKRQKIITLTPH